jgi:hypothetical protein
VETLNHDNVLMVKKQRNHINKEDVASSNVSNDVLLLLTAVIHTYEGRSVTIVHVPGAFMQVDIDLTVYVRFIERIVKLLIGIDS